MKRFGLMALAITICSLAMPTLHAQDDADNKDKHKPDAQLLMLALRHPDGAVRRSAANRLLELRDKHLEQAIELLAEDLKSPHVITATIAAAVLEEMSLQDEEELQQSAVSLLVQGLDHPATDAYRWALSIRLLRRHATLEQRLQLLPRMASAVADHDSHTSIEAMLFLLDIIDPPSEPDEKPLTKDEQATKDKIDAAIAAVRHGLISRLLPLLQTSRSGLKIVIEDKVITGGLVGYVHYTRLEYRLLVLRTLVMLDVEPASVTDPLVSTLQLSNEYAAVEAARLISLLQPGFACVHSARAAAVRTLMELSTTPWSPVRLDAAGRFGAFGHDARVAFPAMTRLLADADADVRLAVTASLAELGPIARPMIPALKAAIAFEKLGSSDNTAAMEKALEKIEAKEKEADEK